MLLGHGQQVLLSGVVVHKHYPKIGVVTPAVWRGSAHPAAPRRPTLEQQSRLAACHPGARLVRNEGSRRIRPAWDTSARDDQPTEALGAIAVKHALRKWPARDPVLCLADEQRTLVYGWLSCFGDPTTTGRTAKRSSTIRSG